MVKKAAQPHFLTPIIYSEIVPRTFGQRLIQTIDSCFYYGGKKAYVIDTKPVDGKIMVDIRKERESTFKVACKVAFVLCIYVSFPLLIVKAILRMTHRYRAMNPSDLIQNNCFGDPAKVIKYYEISLAIHSKLYGNESGSVADSLNKLGQAWLALGDATKAKGYFEDSLKILKKLHGDQSVKVARGLVHLSKALKNLNEIEKAKECCEQAQMILNLAIANLGNRIVRRGYYYY